MVVDWNYYPKCDRCAKHLDLIVNAFNYKIRDIDSNTHNLRSNEVLEILSDEFEKIGYEVEKGKKEIDKIKIPVLFGKNGALEKSFDADAYSYEYKTVVEIEAGRAVANYQFLKDLFESCVMNDVDYLVIAVRKIYTVSKTQKNKDFETICTFFDTLYSSNKLKLPLKGIMVVGY